MFLINCIFLSLIVINTGLYILSLIKKIDMLKTVSSTLILPLSGVYLTIFLLQYLPDSRHIILVTTAALILASVSVILFVISKLKTGQILYKVTYTLNLAVWIELFRSCFFIYRVPALLFVLSSVFYLILTFALFIFIGKQKFYFYFSQIIPLAFSFILHFCSLVYLCFNPCLQTILLFAGTSAAAALIFVYILNLSRYKFKFYRQTLFAILIFSQVVISVSNILLIK